MIQAILSFIFLLILMPIFLLISVVQFFVFERIFFKQKRIGRNAEVFDFYKFQSMKESRQNISEKDRIPAWGSFLRATSLDELPQFFHIIKGEMNFVGPRPLLPEYLSLYSERQKKRHKVRPGITGWAQVKGRNTLSWKEQFELDVWYVENRSWKLDLKIIGMTFQKIFQGNRETQLRKPFNGSN